jgi:hypothetical protein
VAPARLTGGAQLGVPFPPPNVPGPFSLSDPDALRSVLEDGGLEDVIVFTGSSLIATGSKPRR